MILIIRSDKCITRHAVDSNKFTQQDMGNLSDINETPRAMS